MASVADEGGGEMGCSWGWQGCGGSLRPSAILDSGCKQRAAGWNKEREQWVEGRHEGAQGVGLRCWGELG